MLIIGNFRLINKMMTSMHKWDAEDYHKSSADQQKWARELIWKLALKGNERVLDVGCGDGRVAAEVAKQLPNGSILGIDNSEDMTRFARRIFPLKKFPNLTFETMDARNLSFNAEFDIVYSNASLHWVVDHLPVLEGIERCLKTSGKVFLQMAGKGSGREIVEVAERAMKTDKWSKYFADFSYPYSFYGPEEYRSWLERAGLKAKRVELISKDMVQEGTEGLKAWIRTTWLPYTEMIPEDLRQEFIDDIVNKYVEKYPPNSAGLIHVPLMRLDVEAENL